MTSFGVQSKQCSNCGKTMVFHDIVYKSYGSIRELLKQKFVNQTYEKLEQAIEDYGVIKGIVYGRIRPVST